MDVLINRTRTKFLMHEPYRTKREALELLLISLALSHKAPQKRQLQIGLSGISARREYREFPSSCKVHIRVQL
jgi:hypothetical protein